MNVKYKKKFEKKDALNILSQFTSFVFRYFSDSWISDDKKTVFLSFGSSVWFFYALI